MAEIKSRQNFIWHALPIAALIVWGAMCITNNLWYDEAYSAAMVSLPWKRMLYITAVDAHSPFYYGILKLVYLLFGGGTYYQCLKLTSLLFMSAYMLLGKYYVRKLFNQKISIYFMLFSLLMPIMTAQAGNVRMYAFALFFMTLTGLLAYDLYKDATRRKWILFTGAAICTVYCHTFAMIQAFFLFLLFMGGLIYSKQYQKIKHFFCSGIVVALAFTPWLVVTAMQMVLRMRYDVGSVSERATLYSFMDYCKEWFSALETPIGIVVFLGMGIAVVLGYLAVDWMRANKNYAPAIGMGALGLTVLAGGLISVYINNCFLGRYAFPGFGFLMLFYAVGMSRLEGKRMWGVVLAAAMVCFGLQYGSELKLEYDEGLDVYEEFVENQVTEQDVFVSPTIHPLLLSIYHPELQYYVNLYKSYKLPFVNTDALTDYSQLDGVQGNVWYLCFAGGTPDHMSDAFAYEEVESFHYMYYDYVIYRLTRK